MVIRITEFMKAGSR